MSPRFYLLIGSLSIPFAVLALFFNPLVAGNLPVITDVPNYDASWITKSFLFFSSVAFASIAVAYLGYKRAYRKPSKAIRISLIAILCVVGVLSLEMPLRVRPTPSHNDVLDRSPGYEPSSFATHHIPNVDRDILDQTGKAVWRYRNGYHSSGFNREKPNGQIRIVFLGGSHVWSDFESKGIGYGESKNWVEKIENELRERGYKNIKIINGAVAGHRSFDSLGRYLSEIHLFNPDYVFVCHAWNDMKYFWNYSKDNSPLRSLRPLTESSHSYDTGLVALLGESQIVSRFKNIVNRRKHLGLTDSLESSNLRSHKVVSRDLAVAMGLGQFELNLRSLSLLVQETSSVPILLSQAGLADPHNSEEQKKNIGYNYQKLVIKEHDLLCEVWESTNRAVKKAASESGALFFDMAAKMTGNGEYFVDHVHFSSKGGEVAAKILADFIELNLLKKTKALGFELPPYPESERTTRLIQNGPILNVSDISEM